MGSKIEKKKSVKFPRLIVLFCTEARVEITLPGSHKPARCSRRKKPATQKKEPEGREFLERKGGGSVCVCVRERERESVCVCIGEVGGCGVSLASGDSDTFFLSLSPFLF